MSVRPVVVLEFNELTPRLMEQFIDEGVLPNFDRFRRESVAFVTDAEESQEHLNPWIQWPTVHTGVSYDEHRVLKLGEGAALTFSTIAEVVSGAGLRSWICGTMNVPVQADDSTWWLPDPWAPTARAHPEFLEPINAFVRSNVQEHTNVAAGGGPRSSPRAVMSLARHGLRPGTALDATWQLLGERTGRRGRWERATVLDRLQWDVFAWGMRRHRPHFATFFSNSTAHFQHVYWRHFEPQHFAVDVPVADVARFERAIRTGYERMDDLVGRALAAFGEECQLVVCSALGQQPYVAMEASGGKKLHRPYRIEELVDALHIEGVVGVQPVMAEQFHLYFRDADAARSAAAVLEQATVASTPAFSVRQNGSDLLVGCAVQTDVEPGVMIESPMGAVEFDRVLYQLDTSKSGFHHPHGLFWVRRTDPGAARLVEEPVPLRSVASTLLRLLGLVAPESMRAPSLL